MWVKHFYRATYHNDILCTKYSNVIRLKQLTVVWETCNLLYRHTANKFWIPAKNILDAITESEMNIFWTINVLHSKLCTRQRSLIKPTMNVKDILLLLKYHSKKDWETILETSNKKSMRIALNFQNIFRL